MIESLSEMKRRPQVKKKKKRTSVLVSQVSKTHSPESGKGGGGT